METRAHYVAVGAFVLTMIVLAFAAVLWLGRTELTTQYARYDIYFIGPVSGLRVGAAVEYSGVPVGKVTDIRIDRDNADSIRVTVELDANVPIHEDAAALLESNILSGVSYIQIAGGSQDKPLLMPNAWDAGSARVLPLLLLALVFTLLRPTTNRLGCSVGSG